MTGNDALADREADAAALIDTARVQTLKDDKNAFLEFRFDADAVILYRENPFGIRVCAET